jgi:hypothetical protein
LRDGLHQTGRRGLPAETVLHLARARPLQSLCLVRRGGPQPGAVRPPQTDIEPTGASRIATALRSTPLACRCTLAESHKSPRYPSVKCHLTPSDQPRLLA